MMHRRRRPQNAGEAHARLRRAIAGEPLPLALIDLDALDRNLETLAATARARGKTLRLATKSIRSIAVMKYLLQRGGGVLRGVMAFAAREAALLVEHGIDDVLVAYPTLDPHDARAIAETNTRARVSIVVDSEAHLEPLDAAAAAAKTRVPVIIDADMSYRPFGGALHLGVRRSPLHDADAVVALARSIARRAHLELAGVMGYEAQIAGIADDGDGSQLGNLAKRAIRGASRHDVSRLRADIAARLRAEGFAISIFNGGGTGSLSWSSEEDALTEVTAGSGFLAGHLFDGYRGLSLAPAAMFALQVVRRPAEGIVTCAGGGYVASGEPATDRLPLPWLPEGLSLTRLEAAGEVQTPLRVPRGTSIALGDPIFFRHAKSGELAERFLEYLLVRGERIEARAPTYRGLGACFG